MEKPYLSVIIPSYNEEENFQRGVLSQIANFLKKQDFSWEVILVDDGSLDRTPRLLSNFIKKNRGFKLLLIPHGGKFKAIQTGLTEAEGEYVLFSDFDQSTPISELEKFLPYFENGADVIIGSRVAKGAKRINDPPFRYLRSRILNFIIKLVLFRGIDDTQCGFKAFKREAARKLFGNLKVTQLAKPKGGFMGPFDIELLFLARRENYKIISVPVTWHYFPSQRLSFFWEPTKFIIDILRIRLFSLFGKYGE
jgi:glycosyltransferase involved in cell wall biosynthesis